MKKITGLVLCLALIFGTCTLASAQTDYPKTVSEPVRILDGIAELFATLGNILAFENDYGSAGVCPIPELEKDYVPQGFCYIDSENLFAVTYYSAKDDPSIIALIDAKTGKRAKTLELHYDDGEPCYAHVGGVADIGDSLLISSGHSAKRLKIADALAAEDYSAVNFCGTLNTDMQASYLNAYGNLLFVGQFYTFTPQNTYETPKEHRIYTPSGKRSYAMCEVFDLTDMDKAFEEQTAVPEYVISMPNSVQGTAYDGRYFATSSSYSAWGSSKIRYYELGEAQGVFNMNGTDVPLYYVEESNAVKTITIQPMSEGIDMYNGRVAGIFESGANKFRPKTRVSDICVFD